MLHQHYTGALKRIHCTYASAGEAIPSDLDDYAGFFDGSPNEIQWLATMFLDRDLLADYLASNCVTDTIRQPRSLEYVYWLKSSDKHLLDDGYTMVQCVDNFGAWDDFARYSPCAPQNRHNLSIDRDVRFTKRVAWGS